MGPPGKSCRPGESTGGNVTEMIKGAKGERGFQGMKGMFGDKGDTGYTGNPVSITVCRDRSQSRSPRFGPGPRPRFRPLCIGIDFGLIVRD